MVMKNVALNFTSTENTVFPKITPGKRYYEAQHQYSCDTERLYSRSSREIVEICIERAVSESGAYDQTIRLQFENRHLCHIHVSFF